MKYSIVAYTLWCAAVPISASASAFKSSTFHIRQSFPLCAITCITNANLGNCAPTDNVCLCNSQSFVNGTTSCIESACTGADITSAEQLAEAICAAVGVKLK